MCGRRPEGVPQSAAALVDVLFYITVVFSIGVPGLYPGLGTQFKGMLNWTSTGQHPGRGQGSGDEVRSAVRLVPEDGPAGVAADERGRQMGARIFQNNCANSATAPMGAARRGFPISPTANGNGAVRRRLKARSPRAHGSDAAMAPHSAARRTWTDVAHYVLSLSNSAHDSVRATRARRSRRLRPPATARRQGNPRLVRST